MTQTQIDWYIEYFNKFFTLDECKSKIGKIILIEYCGSHYSISYGIVENYCYDNEKGFLLLVRTDSGIHKFSKESYYSSSVNEVKKCNGKYKSKKYRSNGKYELCE